MKLDCLGTEQGGVEISKCLEFCDFRGAGSEDNSEVTPVWSWSWWVFCGSFVGVKDIDFVGRSEAKLLETGAVGRVQGYKKRSARERTHITFLH